MTKQDFSFVPVSDVSLPDMDIINNHKNLMKNGNYNEAVTLLNDLGYEKGVRASFVNEIIKRIQNIGLYLLNLTADQEDYYSIERPDPEWMRENGKLFWIEIITEGE